MKPSLLKEALKTAIAANRPVFIWGPPGVGKSDVVRQTAGETDRDLTDVRALLLDPVDLRGLPHINGDNLAHWCPPAFLPREGRGILFLDELNAAPPLVQAACFQLVLDRRLGEYTLPDGWVVVAAGNREQDRAAANRMPTALRNRFVHLEFDVDVEDWVRWALENGLMTEIIAFIRLRPDLLLDFDPKRNDRAFPTPRAWHMVSDILKTRPDPAIETEIVAGTVGEGAAVELAGFLKLYRELPDPDQILMNPDQATVPQDPATLYALCGALARKASEQNMDRLVRYMDRIPEEFGVLLMRDAVSHNKDITRTRAYIEWTSKHQEVYL